MKTIRLETNSITDWDSFHAQFATLMGFPGFYGCNMDAWIDCMSHLTNPNEGLAEINLEKGEALVIQVLNSNDFIKRLPEIFDALVRCTASVNKRYVIHKESSVVALAFL